jgi:ribosome maturation factor RimP
MSQTPLRALTRSKCPRPAGTRVKIRLARLIDGQRNVDGSIAGADADAVELEMAAGGRLRVPWGAIRKASLVVEDD